MKIKVKNFCISGKANKNNGKSIVYYMKSLESKEKIELDFSNVICINLDFCKEIVKYMFKHKRVTVENMTESQKELLKESVKCYKNENL